MCTEEKTNEQIAHEIGRDFALSIFRYLWLPEASRPAFVQGARDYIAGYPDLERRAVEDAICALQQANNEKVCVLSSNVLASAIAMDDANPFAPGTFPEDEVFAIEHDR